MLGRIKLKKINSYIVLVQNPNFIKNTDHTKKKKKNTDQPVHMKQESQ